MLKANVRLYGETKVDHGGVTLAADHAFKGIEDAHEAKEPGYVWAMVAIDALRPGEDSSALDLYGTLDDFRALIANLQEFVTLSAAGEAGR